MNSVISYQVERYSRYQLGINQGILNVVISYKYLLKRNTISIFCEGLYYLQELSLSNGYIKYLDVNIKLSILPSYIWNCESYKDSD